MNKESKMGTGSKRTNKYLIAVLLLAALFVMQFLFSYAGSLVSRSFDYSPIDSDGVMMRDLRIGSDIVSSAEGSGI